MPSPLFCIAATEAQASFIIEQLHDSGFTGSEISILLPDDTRRKEPSGRGAPGPASDAGPAPYFQDPLGWLAGMGSLSVAGVGPFIAAGPIVSTLSYSATATTSAGGGVKEALLGLGVSERSAGLYEKKIIEGSILISIEPESSSQAGAARKILEQSGAQEICRASEAPAPFQPHGVGSTHRRMKREAL